MCLLGDGPDVGRSVVFCLLRRAQRPLQGRCPAPRNGGPAGRGWPCLRLTLGVSVSGSGRLQLADATLSLPDRAGTGAGSGAGDDEVRLG